MNKLNNVFKMYFMSFILIFILSSCIPPAKVPKYVEIRPNETAFLIPLEGKTKEAQIKFDSIEYLEKRKVAAKRIYLPLVKIKTGRWYWQYKWVPSAIVITVDRKPVVLSWEGKESIHVESKDSIGFYIGVNVTAFIEEKDTARFLYYFPSGDLYKVMNDAVKSKATEILSREFAKYDLETGRLKKGEIIDLAKKELQQYFKRYGITITTFGLTGGLQYEDKEIQKAINENFKSALQKKNELNKLEAQRIANQRRIEAAEAEAKAAKKLMGAKDAYRMKVQMDIMRMKAEALLELAKKWDGKTPEFLLNGNSSMPFLFQLNKDKMMR